MLDRHPLALDQDLLAGIEFGAPGEDLDGFNQAQEIMSWNFRIEPLGVTTITFRIRRVKQRPMAGFPHVSVLNRDPRDILESRPVMDVLIERNVIEAGLNLAQPDQRAKIRLDEGRTSKGGVIEHCASLKTRN